MDTPNWYPRRDPIPRFRRGDVVVCIHPNGTVDKGCSYVIKAIFQASFDPEYIMVKVEGGRAADAHHQERFIKIAV